VNELPAMLRPPYTDKSRNKIAGRSKT